MPLYTDLSAANQAAVDELLQLVRPMMAQLYKIAEQHTVALQLWFAVPPGEVNTLANSIAAIDSTALIPNKTNLVGADSVTRLALQTAMGYVTTVAGFNDATHLQTMLPFAGSANFT